MSIFALIGKVGSGPRSIVMRCTILSGPLKCGSGVVFFLQKCYLIRRLWCCYFMVLPAFSQMPQICFGSPAGLSRSQSWDTANLNNGCLHFSHVQKQSQCYPDHSCSKNYEGRDVWTSPYPTAGLTQIQLFSHNPRVGWATHRRVGGDK